MHWFQYMPNHRLYETLETVERMKTLERLRGRRRRRQLGAIDDRVAELEDELGRMSLLVCALLQLGLEKQAFTPQDLQAQLEAIDVLDGEIDGKLTPGWAHGKAPTEEVPEPQDDPAPRPRRSVRDRLRDEE